MQMTSSLIDQSQKRAGGRRREAAYCCRIFLSQSHQLRTSEVTLLVLGRTLCH